MQTGNKQTGYLGVLGRNPALLRGHQFRNTGNLSFFSRPVHVLLCHLNASSWSSEGSGEGSFHEAVLIHYSGGTKDTIFNTPPAMSVKDSSPTKKEVSYSSFTQRLDTLDTPTSLQTTKCFQVNCNYIRHTRNAAERL